VKIKKYLSTKILENLSGLMIKNIEYNYLKRLRDGDLAAFQWVYEQHHKQVYFFCYKMVGNKEDAEELTEDVFLKLWKRQQIIDPNIPISGLLFKMTKDYAWNHIKKQQRIKEHEITLNSSSSLKSPSAFADFVLKDYFNIADKAIEKLPEKRQKVFKLHYKEGLENKEIAQQLNISEATVRVHLHKAIQFLRNYLKAHPEIQFLLVLGIHA
jgi:RNA polymerase sigma-70 factor (ECF subfamily)